ncbi:MAG: polysaccharide biosynthesis protein, partial [Acidimicrobiales bacterium]
VARRLISQSGRRIDITITGLRPGEKLHEELFGDDEADHHPRHPLISHARVPVIDPDELPVSPEPSVVARFMTDACSAAPRVVVSRPRATDSAVSEMAEPTRGSNPPRA